MAIQHTWKITAMERYTDTHLVYNVYFAVETKDTDKPPYTMTQNMVVSIPFNPDAIVIPYADLTENIVIDWVKQELKVFELNEDGSFVLDTDGNRIMISDHIPNILASGEQQLLDLITPKVETAPLPWAEEA